MTLPQLYVVLLAGGLVLLAGIAAARTASRLGLPSLLLFLGLGVLLGEDVLGVPFDDAQLAQTLGTTALAVILVEGGLSTRWADVRRLLAPSALLATAGVVISVLVTAAGAHYLLGMDWQLALLLGAIVSSTDAAAVFAVLRSLPLPRKLASMVEAESGFNDAPTVILVLVFSASGGVPGPGAIAGQLVYQIATGAALGLVVAMAGVATLRYVALPASACTRWPRSGSASSPSRRPGRPTPLGSSPPTCRGSCSATPSCRTGPPPAPSPRGPAGWRRSGSSSCSACWSTRATCSARWSRRSSSARSCCWWPGRSRCSCACSRSGSPGASRRSSPGRGCAARCRSC